MDFGGSSEKSYSSGALAGKRAVFAVLLKEAKKAGVKTITIAYEETSKNMPAKSFIDKHFINQTYEVTLEIKSPEWIQIHTYENI